MISIRTMTIDDIPLGLNLTRQAGWNQLDTDWRRFIDMQPEGCFVGQFDGQPVATTVTCILGSVAWVAMVLVDMDARRRGVATALLRHALDFLDARQVRTIRLDATAAGEPVYAKLGFVPEYRLTRYQGIARHRAIQAETARAGESDFAEVFAFDQERTATERAKMLSRLFAESPHGVHVLRPNGRLEGYICTRSGANAIQIGPCVATPHAGETLLADALTRCAGQAVFVDVPHDNAPATAFVQAAGLKGQRHFMRMYRGDRIIDQPQAIWASSGPEKG